MRKIVYGAVVTAAAVLVGVLVVQEPQPSTASASAQAGGISVRALQASIDVQGLPRQDILSEADPE